MAWDLTADGTRITGRLHNIRRLVSVTTHGSSKWLNMVEGESGRRVIGRAVRLLCKRSARTMWVSMYNIDRSTPEQRAAFVERVHRRLRKL